VWLNIYTIYGVVLKNKNENEISTHWKDEINHNCKLVARKTNSHSNMKKNNYS
jgi:hypothetical protein